MEPQVYGVVVKMEIEAELNVMTVEPDEAVRLAIMKGMEYMGGLAGFNRKVTVVNMRNVTKNRRELRAPLACGDKVWFDGKFARVVAVYDNAGTPQVRLAMQSTGELRDARDIDCEVIERF